MAKIQHKTKQFPSCWSNISDDPVILDQFEAAFNAVPEENGEPGSELWRQWHTSGISSTDSMAILNGSDGWKTALDVYFNKWDKRAVQPDNINVDQEDSLALDMGNAAEPVIFKYYCKRMGLEPGKDAFRIPRTGWRSKAHSWLITTPDCLILGHRKGAEFKYSQKPKEWGSEENAEVPPKYYMQCVHHMLVLGVSEWDLCVLLPNYEIRVYPLTLDTDVSKAMLINYMAFWENNVKPAIPPQLRNFEAPEVLRALTKHYNKVIEGEVVDLTDLEGLVSDYYHAGKVISDVSKQRDKLKALILKDMKNSQLGTAGRFTIERSEVKKRAYQVKEQVNIKLTVKDTQAIGKEEREEIE